VLLGTPALLPRVAGPPRQAPNLKGPRGYEHLTTAAADAAAVERVQSVEAVTTATDPQTRRCGLGGPVARLQSVRSQEEEG